MPEHRDSSISDVWNLSWFTKTNLYQVDYLNAGLV